MHVRNECHSLAVRGGLYNYVKLIIVHYALRGRGTAVYKRCHDRVYIALDALATAQRGLCKLLVA